MANWSSNYDHVVACPNSNICPVRDKHCGSVGIFKKFHFYQFLSKVTVTLGRKQGLFIVKEKKKVENRNQKQKSESRMQKAESRKQKEESRKQKAENRKQKTESRKQKVESKKQKVENRKQSFNIISQ